MGRKDDAIREGQRAVELKPESKDAIDGAIMNCYLALIYARVGKKDLAIPLIERLLKTPGAVDSVNYGITLNDLNYRWEWDGLRNDPRFQKLVSEQPKKCLDHLVTICAAAWPWSGDQSQAGVKCPFEYIAH